MCVDEPTLNEACYMLMYVFNNKINFMNIFNDYLLTSNNQNNLKHLFLNPVINLTVNIFTTTFSLKYLPR